MNEPLSSRQRKVEPASLAAKAKLTERNLWVANTVLAGRWRNLVRGGVLSRCTGFFFGGADG
ncbi:MAG TPA: hypothetical protein VK471_06835 [Solirubrobacterales bacterium]|nr:hypothetical protein [Solirubrobacterales bacterium]